MVASGSEVSTLVAGAELLHKDGVKTRIVSVPSEGLFRSQSKEYQESILPAGAKVFRSDSWSASQLVGSGRCKTARFGDWNHSVSLLHTKCWMKNWASLLKMYITK